MIRQRLLQAEEYKVSPDSPKKNIIYSLYSGFSPDPASEELDEEECAVKIEARLIWDNDGGFMEPCLHVLPTTCSLPPLWIVQEEVNYMFNLLKSFEQHETSQRTPPQSPDFKEISD